jgi:hypothetical protein
MKPVKITKLAVFVDYDNFVRSYCRFHDVKEREVGILDDLADTLIRYYSDHFVRSEFEVVDHVGTFLCVGMSEFMHPKGEEAELKKWFQAMDRRNGFVVKYGTRSGTHYDKTKERLVLGREKGVDAEIICQMLMGAFLNHYDACILMSDDADYIPVIRRIQDYFGKKVIQAGDQDDPTRNQAYGHIPFEEMDRSLSMKPDGIEPEEEGD